MQVERQLQPVGFLGVDVEADIVALGQQRQRLQRAAAARPSRGRCCAAAIARMQRRKLDRDAGPAIDAAPGRRLADGVDRVLIGA